MGKIMELTANDLTIKLEIVHEEKWCRITYIKNDMIIPLGADVFNIIKERLLDYLKNEKQTEKTIYNKGNAKVIWILSLMEEHTVLYGTLPNSFESTLFWQQKDLLYLPSIFLNRQTKKLWIDKLRIFEA